MEVKRQKEGSGRTESNKVRAIDKLRVMRARELKRRFALIEEEIDRRKNGLDKEIEGIKASSEYSEAKKDVLIGQTMQREVVTADMVSLMLEICDKLDKLTFRTVA